MTGGKALKGVVLGPLGYDVELVLRATDTAIKSNEVRPFLLPPLNLTHASSCQTLIRELLVSRPPSELSLLRRAFNRRTNSSLDDAVLSTCVGNARLKKIFELVLAARWDDETSTIGEDVDQLKVAFRAKPANLDVVSVTLFPCSLRK